MTDSSTNRVSSTYSPEIYDLVTPASFRGDVEFYVNLAAAANGPVLELGAGTGRITLELARRGVNVTALDSNSEMLARLSDKLVGLDEPVRALVSVVEGDMRSFPSISKVFVSNRSVSRLPS